MELQSINKKGGHIKKIFFLSLLFILPIALFSHDLTLVSEGESNYVATNWLFYINRIPLKGKLGSYQIKFIEQVNYRQQPLCVIYHLNPRGHILTPLYKEFSPIKSFSVVSDFDPESKGYESAVLKEIKTAFDFLQAFNCGDNEELEKTFEINSNQWNRFINLELETALLEEKFDLIPELKRSDKRNFLLTDEFSNKIESTQANPLLSTRWSQDDPYWNWCPILGGKRCYVGCTATAMAQILRYHRWPKEGEGSHSYYWSKGSTTLSANFSDSYDWDYMPDNTWEYDTNKEKEAVAELCYEAGVSIDMDYGTEGSGAYVYDVDDALKTYFKYSNEVTIVYRKDYADVDAWFDVLKGQRDLSRPSEFAMYSEDSGHAVVIDGYLITDGLKQVHINMGWGGNYDSYYTLDGILGFTDTYWQHAVINIIPNYITPKEAHIELSPNSLSFKGSEGESNLASQTFKVKNSGKGEMNYQLDVNTSWLNVSPISGSSTDEWDNITASVNISGLSSGNYTGTVSITSDDADNSPQNLAVYLTVLEDQPPSVLITSPDNGDFVNKTIVVKANASDDKGVTKVEFYIDNVLKRTDASLPYNWNWDTTKNKSGAHNIKAKAHDTINQTAEHTIQITIDQPPSISITSPSSGSNVYGMVTIKTSISDDFGINKVEFYVNGGLYKIDKESPYIFNWGTNKILNGKYTVKAVVYDTRNQTAQHQINLIRIPHTPVDFSGRKENNSSVLLEQYINVLTWQSNDLNTNISKYKIYQRDGEDWVLLDEVNADTFNYWHRNAAKDETYGYALKAVDNQNNEGESTYTEVQ